MHDLDLDAIEERARKATPGRWVACHVWDDYGDQCKWMAVAANSRDAPTDADIDFVTHSRTDVPALVAEVRRLRAIEAAARAYLETSRGAVGYDELEAFEELDRALEPDHG